MTPLAQLPSLLLPAVGTILFAFLLTLNAMPSASSLLMMAEWPAGSALQATVTAGLLFSLLGSLAWEHYVQKLFPLESSCEGSDLVGKWSKKGAG